MESIQPTQRRTFLWLLCIAVVVGFAFQGSRGLFETTEGRYAECAREMLATGDWWTPRLDDLPHWTKPPLTYWTIAGGMLLFGHNEWGARAANGLIFVVLTLVVAHLGGALWDRQTGLVAGLVYATSLFPVAAANSLSTDLLLSLWEVLAALCYWKAFTHAGRAARCRWILAMWLALGAGFLTKGPPSLLTLLSVIIFHVWMRARGVHVPKLFHPLGVLLFGVVGLSWFVAMALTHAGLTSYFLGQEVVARITSPRFHRNPEWYQPIFIYLLPAILGAGPWLVFWPRIWRRWRGGLIARLQENRRALFLFLWLTVPMVVLSLSRSRLPLYGLPFFAVIALLLARALVATLDRDTLWRTVMRIAWVAAAVLVITKGVAARIPIDQDTRRLYRACHALAPGERRVLLLDCSEMHGLQFYLDGRLERVSSLPTPAPPARELDAVVREIAESAAGARFILISKAGRVLPEELRRGSRLHTEPRGQSCGFDLWEVGPAGDSAQAPRVAAGSE